MKFTLLLVDDEGSIRETLKIVLTGVGYNVVTAKDGPEALAYLKGNMADILITDLKMPGMNGIQLMEKALEIDPYLETIFISAYADIRSAVKALKMGAFDYIEKSFTNDELIFAIRRALERKKLLEENKKLKGCRLGEYSYHGVIGISENMQSLFYLIDRVAGSKANILLTGESGVGKELIAKLIHRNSCRGSGQFIPINCGAIPVNLVEAELFGYERGAFTGASHSRRGKFELAHNGTLFLDEIGDLPLQMQVKLLRVLQEKQFFKIGGEKNIKVNSRIIAATNKVLEREVKEGRFREDLFYRINVININIPPLRERKEDIPLLAKSFLEEFSKEYGKKLNCMDIEALHHLVEYPWKGNVRELRNIIERSVLFADCNEEILYSRHLPRELRGGEEGGESEKAGLTLQDYERILIENTLKRNRGNKSKTAKMLGIRRQTLYNKLRSYGEDSGS